jgi:DNA-binding CsgD family transcriptional regulator
LTRTARKPVARRRKESAASIVERLGGEAYDAALGDLPWEAALARLRDALRADAATFVLYDSRAGAGGYACAIDIPEKLQRDYADYYWSVDPFRLGAARLGIRPGVAVTDAMLVPERELLCSEGYNDGMKPHGFRYLLGGGLSHAGSAGAALSLMRLRTSGPYDAGDRATMAALLPRWRRAVSLHAALGPLEGPWPLLLAAEDAAGRGVVVIDGRGLIRAANRTAERHLAAASAIYSSRHRLHARDANADCALERAIAFAGDRLSPQPPFRVTAPRGEHAPLQLRVLPAPASRFGRGNARAVLVMIDEPHPSTDTLDAFARRFGLTRAERDLLESLVGGDRLIDAAQRLQRSHNTARNQLQAIFAKTETHRQGELIAKALRARA